MREDLDVKRFTLKQATRSIDGFELLSIKKQTGSPLSEVDQFDLPRVLIWVVENRSDKNMLWNEAMGLTIGDYEDYFVAEEEADPLEQKKMNES